MYAKPLTGDYNHWVGSAKDGSKVIYHTGFLLKDRKKPMQLGNGMVFHIVQSATVKLQKDVWQSYLNGHVVLYQQKLGDGQYAYIAERTR